MEWLLILRLMLASFSVIPKRVSSDKEETKWAVITGLERLGCIYETSTSGYRTDQKKTSGHREKKK